jgi:predicted metal-dependent HD superfamily phosphohydrolase
MADTYQDANRIRPQSVLSDGARFQRLCQRCLPATSAADPVAVYTELKQRYGEPHRYYHTGEHLQHCFDLVDQTAAGMDDATAVEMGLWFHDAIYTPQALDNELRSAELFLARIGQYSDPDFSRRVYAMIMVTTHRSVPQTRDEQFIIDIDLSSLGLPWEGFCRNGEDIRQEYAQVPDALFFAGRYAFLQGLLNRPHLYFTDFIRNRYEAIARDNLQRCLAELRAQGYGPPG